MRLQGGVSLDSPVLSACISSSSTVRFVDDMNLYHGISSVDDCTILQNDLNSVYDWASCNNMSFNAQKFQYICFSPHSSLSCNIYTNSSFGIINYSRNIRDLTQECRKNL